MHEELVRVSTLVSSSLLFFTSPFIEASKTLYSGERRNLPYSYIAKVMLE